MQISDLQISQVNNQIQSLRKAGSFYGKKLEEAGISGISTPEDFASLPFSEKNLHNASQYIPYPAPHRHIYIFSSYNPHFCAAFRTKTICAKRRTDTNCCINYCFRPNPAPFEETIYLHTILQKVPSVLFISLT